MENLRFRSERQQHEWLSGSLHPLLSCIFLEAFRYAQVTVLWAFEIECIYRTPEEDAAVGGHGIHPLWRAIDIRTAAVGVEPRHLLPVVSYVNSRWVYDPLRPDFLVALDETDSSTGSHLHAQCHPNTVRRSQT